MSTHELHDHLPQRHLVSPLRTPLLLFGIALVLGAVFLGAFLITSSLGAAL